MISRVFIDRPIFAWVIAIVIMLAGADRDRLSLPIEQYPDIAPHRASASGPPTPGASAETLEASVTQVIEQQLTGIDGLLYCIDHQLTAARRRRSPAPSSKGTDPDNAQVQVQNKRAAGARRACRRRSSSPAWGCARRRRTS